MYLLLLVNCSKFSQWFATKARTETVCNLFHVRLNLSVLAIDLNLKHLEQVKGYRTKTTTTTKLQTILRNVYPSLKKCDGSCPGHLYGSSRSESILLKLLFFSVSVPLSHKSLLYSKPSSRTWNSLLNKARFLVSSSWSAPILPHHQVSTEMWSKWQFLKL